MNSSSTKFRTPNLGKISLCGTGTPVAWKNPSLSLLLKQKKIMIATGTIIQGGNICRRRSKMIKNKPETKERNDWTVALRGSDWLPRDARLTAFCAGAVYESGETPPRPPRRSRLATGETHHALRPCASVHAFAVGKTQSVQRVRGLRGDNAPDTQHSAMHGAASSS